MTKQSTGFKDRNKKVIHVGDTVKCDHPIYTEPKIFVVEWDSVTKKYNLPSDAEMIEHCEVVQFGS